MAMIGLKGDPRRAQALRLVKEWAAARFRLPDDAVISVSELACLEPGCPPHETVIVFWDGGGRRHQFKIVKPATEITADDVGRLGGPGDDPLAGCC